MSPLALLLLFIAFLLVSQVLTCESRLLCLYLPYILFRSW